MEKQLFDRQRSASQMKPAKSFLIFSLTVCMLFLMTKGVSAQVADSNQWIQLFNGKDLT